MTKRQALQYIQSIGEIYHDRKKSTENAWPIKGRYIVKKHKKKLIKAIMRYQKKDKTSAIKTANMLLGKQLCGR